MTALGVTAASRLRALMRERGMITAPGAYDCIGARLIEQAGFAAVYMTGAGTAATLGYPDFGLLTMTEMVENAGRLAAAVTIPVVADADTGYGNELNVVRTVREYEKRGVAGIHIEDQGFPKRCGHLDNKEIISLEDYLAKIRAAASAKKSPDFVIIARTDSRASQGLEEAVRRANASLDAGADMAFIEAPQTAEEVAAIPRLVKGPCLLNVVWGGKTPTLDLAEAEKLGFKLAILPGLLFKGAMNAFDALLQEVKATRRHPAMGATVREVFRRMGADEWEPLRERFRDASPAELARRKPAAE
ncbi:MAG TPA: isocitrate lyase/PEP mutase family protein [Alphaproteobacteria bacterium]|nr:isocitrate lyase/PEP mutase family protein [Alphaproteobacteria bacterium]